MSSDTDRKKECKTCPHFMSSHTQHKCKKCKGIFEVCQALDHGYRETGDNGGWRLCKASCYCGAEFYPDKVRAARPLQPHEYKTDHEGYRPLPEDDYDAGEGSSQHYSSSPPQGGTWSQGHARVDSGSTDELSWTREKWTNETGGMDDLAQKFEQVGIVEWSSWSWSQTYGQWMKTRGTDVQYAQMKGEWTGWTRDETDGTGKRWYSAAQDPDGKWVYQYTYPEQAGEGSNQKEGEKAKAKAKGKGKGKGKGR